MTLRRWLIVGMVLAVSASAGCRHGCGDRRLCGNARVFDGTPGRLLSNPGPAGYSDGGYASAPFAGTPVAAPGGYGGPPPNELPFPGGETIAPPGVPLAQGRPELPAPLTMGAPVGLPK